MLFIPSGGGQVAANTPGIIAAFKLPEGSTDSSAIIGTTNEVILLLIASIAVISAIYIVFKIRTK